MLPKAARMRRRTDFTVAIKSGSRFGRSLLVGHLLTRAGCDEPAKVGFIVSRAVGQAVVRNKVRRRLRHLVAGYLHELPGGSLLVLRANPRAAAAGQAELAAELDVVVKTLLRRQSGARREGVRRGVSQGSVSQHGGLQDGCLQRGGLQHGGAV